MGKLQLNSFTSHILSSNVAFVFFYATTYSTKRARGKYWPLDRILGPPKIKF